MDPTMPWYKSAIIRQQIVQLILVVLGLFGIVTDVDWSVTVEAIFTGIAGVVAVWTIITRLFKPAPNMTSVAAEKEQKMILKGTHPTQGGFVRLSFVWLLAAIASLFVLPGLLSGCTGTKAAYKAADSLADTAYVITEHYAAVLHEAAELREHTGTPAAAVKAMQEADRIVKPLILGDPTTGRAGLRELAQTYTAVRTAETEAELQDAINRAVRELSKLINAVKTARRNP